jgi:hypothetical protein
MFHRAYPIDAVIAAAAARYAAFTTTGSGA